ncbi:hypothetical protein NM688_g7475 [Phlebia brevispora]|uniref:Uncharacterized protein n=1 Tax=Phlebia brevispora TaxID=194682 RepID=A0ACC1S4U7_9APHY|nr:hypothetical protein NM688_g7475 [Phlebia brevispora]
MEILKQIPEADTLDAVFAAIGGGGLVGGIASYVKRIGNPATKVIGAETYDGDAMERSLEEGDRITLNEVGPFSDGTAVKIVGVEPFRICKQLLDDVVKVNTDEICAAIKDIFEETRSITEPAGALALACLKRYIVDNKLVGANKRFVAVVSGANMNFDRLRFVAERAELGEGREALLSVEIPETPGSFIKLHGMVHPRATTEFIYRYNDPTRAQVFLSFQLSSTNREKEVSDLLAQLKSLDMQGTDISDNELAKSHGRYMIGGRVNVPDERLFRFEFPERPGALRRFLEGIHSGWNISLFHYRNHGADIGKVLAGIQVPSGDYEEFDKFLQNLGYHYVEETHNPVKPRLELWFGLRAALQTYMYVAGDLVVVFLRLQDSVLYDDIGREGDERDAEAREHLAEHGPALEDRVLSPRLCLAPGVTKEEWTLRVGHLVADYVAMLSEDDMPLRANAGPSSVNGFSNGYVVTNGNGALDSSSLTSEDDDLPLSQTTKTKSEPVTPDVRALKRKKAPVLSDSSDDDTPLASSPLKQSRTAAVPMPGAVQATTVPTVNGNGTGKRRAAKKSKTVVESDSDGDDEHDGGYGASKGKRAKNGKVNGKPPKKRAKKEEVDDDFGLESEDDKPLVVQKKRAAPTKGKRKKVDSEGDDEEDDKPLKKAPAKKTPAKRVKKEAPSGSETPQPKKRVGKAKKEDSGEEDAKKAKKKEEEDEDIFRWWEQENEANDGSEKWQMLEHNGVYFPPPYEPLPPTVKMRYNGQDVNLTPVAEEVAGFYAALLETDHAKDKTFNKNFFEDFLEVLKKNPPRDGTKITKLELCDFRPMFEYFENEKARKKAMSSAEKKEAKAAKDALEAPYTLCTLDGRKEKVGNFRVEPPGLFRGRGDHPKKGKLKLRVRPEDITINIGDGVPIPKPNVPGNWKAVVHDKTVTWLANWVENVNGNYKYVFLAAGSSLKGQSDMSKFEKSRTLKEHVDRIRADYTSHLKSKVTQDRQRATAMYFIDRLALRAGNEKGEDEADTVGCCSLRYEHIVCEPPNFLVFDFLGKDSIRYYNRVQVDEQVFKNITLFKKDLSEGDPLFDRVDPPSLNKHLSNYMKGLTAKVFRTYNASITFQQQLDQGTPEEGTVQEKLNAYNHANRMVAILCNHQRAVPRTHEASMQKMKEKLRGLKYDRMKLRHALFAIDAKYKKNKKYAEEESDLDDDAIAEHEDVWKARELEKAEKKFQKENEKLAADDKKPQPDSVLKERLDEIETEFKRLKKERGTRKAQLKRDKPTEKIEADIEKLDDKIKTFKLQMEDREAGKEVALSTSKINYLDPRITAAWCKKHNVPIEKIFSKTLINKFPWALEVEKDWKF